MAVAVPIIANYRPPEALKITASDVADNWRRFKDQWNNYTSLLLTYRMPAPRKEQPFFSRALAVTHTTHIAQWISTQKKIARKSIRLSKSSNTFGFVQST